MRNYRSLIAAFIALAGGLGLAPKSTPPTLKKVAEFDLPGPPGKRCDYLTITPDDRGLRELSTFPSLRRRTRRMPTTTPSV